MAKKTNVKFPSELRLDLVSQDWVVIATGRARRPETFKKEKRKEKSAPKSKCPFCKIEMQITPTLILDNTIVIPNKFPAFLPSARLNEKTEGKLYKKMNAAGFHEVVITRDHQKSIAQFSLDEIKELISAYQHRYLDLMDRPFVNYIAIFHNHGLAAGASISHPHSQIITTPLIDKDLSKALDSAKRYFQKEKKCVYCEMDKWERKIKKRIVFENKEFLAICPFASKSAFQVIISPKKHLSNFENITKTQKKYLAEAFGQVMKKLYKALNNPAYNFYLHTAPIDGKKHGYYHWHWTILPKTSTWAGFEIGTHMEISTIEPEKAAQYLRKL